VPDVDHLIVGAGLSGLLLARALQDHGTVAVVEADPSPPAPLTYAYFASGPHPLDPWQVGSWRELAVVLRDGSRRVLDLGGLRYTAAAWHRARADLRSRLPVHYGQVGAVVDGDRAALVQVDDAWRTARFVYDSRDFADVGDLGTARVTAVQRFAGVWTTPAGQGSPVFMDLRPSGADLAFRYELPGADVRLVMAVTMGHPARTPDPRGMLGGISGPAEEGRTLLAVPFPDRRVGRRILRIGRSAGLVRASTGYAVSRIASDTEQIAASVARHGHPFALARRSAVEHVLDRVWLQALIDQRAAMAGAFEHLFSGVPGPQLFRFLDGRATPADLFRVARSLPLAPFVRSALRTWSR
jgi:lycopene beta-cyclase